MQDIFEYDKEELEQLLRFGFRDDCHEPDEAGITAVVVGNKFDNAYGNTVKKGDPYQEKVVIYRKNDGSDKREVRLNLASLTSYALYGYKKYQEENNK